MARRKRITEVILGTPCHRRTESEYMATFLEAVPLEAWREVVAATVYAVKEGDASARSWLAQYLIGKPEAKAPTPLTIVVQRLNGDDPLTNRLAAPLIGRAKYGGDADHELEESIRAMVAAELTGKLLSESPEAADHSVNSAFMPVDGR